MQTIHKSSQTPVQKLLNNRTFTQEQVIELLNALHPADTHKPLTVDATVSGIATKKPSKPKPTVGAVIETNDKGYELLRITGTDGRDFAFGVRKAKEILANLQAIQNFVAGK